MSFEASGMHLHGLEGFSNYINVIHKACPINSLMLHIFFLGALVNNDYTSNLTIISSWFNSYVFHLLEEIAELIGCGVPFIRGFILPVTYLAISQVLNYN